MIKNWIALGDAAFDSQDMPMGIVHINEDDADHWVDITIGQLRKAAESPKVQEMASQADRIRFDLLLYRQVMVNRLMKKKLLDAVSEIFDNIYLGSISLRIFSRKHDNMVFITFENEDGWPVTYNDEEDCDT